MKYSILNDVLGPVMHGPSSSHTAASYHIAKLVRMLTNNSIKTITIFFDDKKSFGRVFKAQKSENAFIAGILGIKVDDPRFMSAHTLIKSRNIDFNIILKPLPQSEHPNFMVIDILTNFEEKIEIEAKSIGGGMVILEEINGWEVNITGTYSHCLIEVSNGTPDTILKCISEHIENMEEELNLIKHLGKTLIHLKRPKPYTQAFLEKLKEFPEIIKIWQSSPIFFPIIGKAIFQTAEEVQKICNQKSFSLGHLGLVYETQLLSLSEGEIIQQIYRRISIMFSSLKEGFTRNKSEMALLTHSASKIKEMENKGEAINSGINLKAAYRALAVMDSASSGNLICAAPTGGSSGVLPAVLYTLYKEYKIDMKELVFSALAAGVIGILNAFQSTFAAEIAGCQVEIGMAGAMATAAIIEALKGNVEQALNAASISLQNTMGSVCDLVAGFAEIPCHARNAIAASNAFICVDLVRGGYNNPITLDDAIIASFLAGKSLPSELRCTSMGGLAVTRSAKQLEKRILLEK